MKPISSIRSASSRTTISTLFKLMFFCLTASWAFYTSAVATHGNQAPLQTLLDSTAQRITLLGNLYQQFGVPLPVLSSPTPEPLVTGWRESLERALQGTFNSTGVYQQLVTLTPDPTLCREFERLQSELLTCDLPALQRAWQAAVDRERLLIRLRHCMICTK